MNQQMNVYFTLINIQYSAVYCNFNKELSKLCPLE